MTTIARKPKILSSKNVYITEEGYYKIKPTATDAEKKEFKAFMDKIKLSSRKTSK